MDDNNFKSIADKMVLDRVPGLSEVVLQKYRIYLKKRGLLKTRERLLESRDLPLLLEIVTMKKSNSALFYNRIIETVVDRYVAKQKFHERVILPNDNGAKINDAFTEICKSKGVEIEQIDDFFAALNSVTDFFVKIGADDVSSTLNGYVDISIAAVVGKNIVAGP